MGVASAAERASDKTTDREPTGGRDRLGGARADFVANLGRRRAELRATLDALRDDPASKRSRDELRRRIHALAAGAKLLRFPRLAEELKTLEFQLEEAAVRGELSDADFGAVHDLIGRMTSLAWGQTEETETTRLGGGAKDGPRARDAEATREPSRAPISVLVVGAGTLADALVMPHGRAHDDAQSFEVERTSEGPVALDLARALAPDVAVIDADVIEAKGVIEALLSDPLTEGIPLIVCQRIVRPDDAGPFMALGVARVLPKPVSPGELRRACAAAVATYVRREVVREPLGDINLDQLGARLAEELRRGLCDTVDPGARDKLIKLGEGTELLAALWGAVARIRDVVTIRTSGQVRFALGGPEGAVPLAPWLEGSDVSVDASKRNVGGRLARLEAEGSLDKTRILVADDDAAVCWFLAGVLKTAGATVYEARDGARALEIAKHVNPDLVISDILMPKLDGFALSRALRRDIALRDVPIVLLSWKEDLLQRVRELGADADGYMRKEASAGAVVQRVRELLRLRQRVAQRIAQQGEVRGRLDGLTTHTLLRLVCALRESSTVSVRDASYLYEVEVRRGKPVRATRTALNGSFERGASVLSALLGVGDGRFSVSPPREDSEVGPVKSDLGGTLSEQVTPVVASARAAQRLLTGESLMRVKRVEIDEDAVLTYWGATPEPARSIVTEIAAGAVPRDLITSGRTSARLLEDVLLDAAVHGAVIQVIDGDNEDRLPVATAQELALLRGERTASPIAQLPVLNVPAAQPATPSPVAPIDVVLPAADDLLRRALAAPAPAPAAEPVAPAAPVIDAAGNTSPLSRAVAHTVDPVASAPPEAHAPALDLLDDLAVGLEDPWFGDVNLAGSSLSLPEPASDSPAPPSGPRLLSPPPAMVEAALRTQSRELTPTPSRMPPPPGLKPMLTLGSLHPPPVAELEPVPTPKPKNIKKSPAPAPVAEKESSKDQTPKFPLPSAYLPYAQPEKKRDHKTLYWIAFALVGVGFALWARYSREKSIASESAVIAEMAKPADGQAPAPEAAAAGPEDPAAASEPQAGPGDASRAKTDDTAPEDLPLREGERLKKGHGLLEIVSGKSDTIYVDGKPMGSGPVLSTPMRARKEPYEIKVKTRGEERTRFVTVKDQRLVRLRMAPPWQR